MIPAVAGARGVVGDEWWPGSGVADVDTGEKLAAKVARV